MGRRIHVLYVDDNPASLRFRSRLLEQFEGIEVTTASSVSEGLRRLEGNAFDCVLSDLHMPDQDGLDFLRDVRSRHAELPFILFTAGQPQAAVGKALEADVTDYIVKRDVDEFQDVLINRIRQYVSHYRAKQRIDELEGDGDETAVGE